MSLNANETKQLLLWRMAMTSQWQPLFGIRARLKTKRQKEVVDCIKEDMKEVVAHSAVGPR